MVKPWFAALAAGMVAMWLGTAQAEAPAQPQAQPDFSTWLTGFKSEAEEQGISRRTLDQVFTDVAPIDRVLELDRRQPEFTLTFDEYLAHVITPDRLENGRQLMRDNQTLLGKVAAHYGVPPKVIVAMWGIETDYGQLTGGFSVVPALATLAYDGRRSRYFKGELINALRIVDAGIPAERMKGSWAGAMGQCQFMPSTYLKYAKAWSGEGEPDIWLNRADVFASAANYLSQIGWNPHQTWGRPVQLPKGGIAPRLFGLEVKKSLKEWARLGIRLPDGKPLPKRSNLHASLIRAETGKGEDVGKGAPYLVYDNFRVFMKWNRSIFFALAAGTLADDLASK